MKPHLLFSLLTLLLSLHTAQAEPACEVRIQASDALEFDIRAITVPDNCATLTVELVHTGVLPKAATGHNWVLTTYREAEQVARDAYRAGQKQGWIKPDDKRIIASTPIIGRGETATVTIDLSQLDRNTRYAFLCTVGGHSPRMRGTLEFVNPQTVSPPVDTPAPDSSPTSSAASESQGTTQQSGS